MNYLKKIGMALAFSFPIFFLSMLLFTFLEYIGFLSPNTFKILLTISIIISFFIGGFVFGKRSIKKGWLEGIKLSFIDISIIFIFTILISDVQIKSIILYLIIIFCTTLGSIVGVNRKKN